jgi:hypothetical protein
MINRYILAAAAAACLVSTQANAQFRVTRVAGGGTDIQTGDDTVAGNPIVAAGTYTTANLQDNGGTGNPNDFNSTNGNPDFDIPGDVIGVDESDWTLHGHGILRINTAGSYIFRSGSDDSSRIVLDGRNVNVQPGCCGNIDGPAITLSAGSVHHLSFNIKEGAGGGNGEFSVSRNGGPFTLLGTGVSPDYTVDQAYPGPVGAAPGTAGLTARVYSVPGMPNQNRDTNAFLATNPTPVLTQNAPTTASGALPADTLVTATGFLRVLAVDDIDPATPAIDVKFRFSADDNGLVDIGGLRIIENDGGHGTPHFVSGNFDTLAAGTGDNAGGTAFYSFPNEGLYPLFAYIHNGGGGGSGDILSSIGGVGGSMQSIPASRLQTAVPEPSTIVLLGSAAAIGLLARRRRKA